MLLYREFCKVRSLPKSPADLMTFYSGVNTVRPAIDFRTGEHVLRASFQSVLRNHNRTPLPNCLDLAGFCR